MKSAKRLSSGFWRKRQKINREVVVAKEKNRSGRFLKIMVRSSQRMAMICIPELSEDLGWNMVAERIDRFVGEVGVEKPKVYDSYKEAAEIPPWPNLSLKIRPLPKDSVVDFEVEERSCEGTLNFLERCLVGRVGALIAPFLQGWSCKMGGYQMANSRWREGGRHEWSIFLI